MSAQKICSDEISRLVDFPVHRSQWRQIPHEFPKTPLTVEESHPVCRRARPLRFRMQVRPHSRVLYFGHVAIQSNVRGMRGESVDTKTSGPHSSPSPPIPRLTNKRNHRSRLETFWSENRGMKLEKESRKRKRAAFRGAKNFEAR